MNTPAMTIRPAKPEDAVEMVRLHRAAVQAVSDADYPANVREAWSPPPTPEREAWLVGRITDSEIFARVADDGGRIVGFVFASPLPAKVHALYVHPDEGGRGVGRALLEAAEAHARAQGAGEMVLMASRNAVRFYEACGYTRGEDTTQALADGTVMDAVHMRRGL